MSDPAPCRPDLGRTCPLVPPLYQSSVYTLADLDALDAIYDAGEPGFIYARDAHPNASHLAARLAAIEGGSWAVVCGSGMAAITAILLSHLSAADHVVASNRLYGKSTALLSTELARFGVHASFVDTNDLSEVKKALSAPTRLLHVETISNPLLRVADIAALAVVAHDHGCRLVVDNTFATPVLCRPLELGADLVMESLTKMIGGHSDVTLGLVCGKGEIPPEVPRVVSTWGLTSGPFDCWLAERGLATLPLRMQAASANALQLAPWLAAQPGVSRVIYPGLPDHPDHELARRVLGGHFGNLLCFELAGGRDAVNHFLHQARGVPLSPSLGDTTTTCSHPATTSHRFVSPAEKKRQGITDGLVRLSVGIEEIASIRAELSRGLT